MSDTQTTSRRKSGPKPRTNEKQKARKSMLTDRENDYLVNKHGTYAAAVRSLLVPGWDEAPQPETDDADLL